MVILGIMSATGFLCSVPNAVMFGSGRGDRLAQFGLLTLVLTSVGQIAVVLSGAGLIGLALVSLAGALLGLTISTAFAGRATGASIRKGHFDRTLLSDMLRFGGVQSVIALCGLVAFQLDALVIGAILPVAQVAPYNIALSTANLTRSISTQGTNLLVPTYAHLDATGDRERQARYFLRAVLVGLVISLPILIALAAFGYPILQFWLGTVPPKTYEIVLALGAVTSLQLPGHQCFIFLTGVGSQPASGQIGGRRRHRQPGREYRRHLPVGTSGAGPRFIARRSGARFRGAPDRRLSIRRDSGISLCQGRPGAGCPGHGRRSGAAGVLLHLHRTHGGVQAIIEATIVVMLSWITTAVVVSRLEPDLWAVARERIRRLGRRV